MNNRCLIIMPPGESSDYPQGHVNRVYDYVIVPACRLAGYWPTRVDNTSYKDPLDVVKEIVDSEIVICDLSANNSNALYGLAIRHVFGLPVTLIKDTKSFATFDAKEQGIVEYDETLRIDTVQKAIEVLSEAMKNAVETKKERHELLYRLNIGLPQVTLPDTNVTSDIITSTEETTHQEAEAKAKEVRLPIISPLPDYVGDPFTQEQIDKLKAGDVFFHLNHGKGKVNFIKKDKLASIQFEAGPMLLVLVASDFYRKIKD